MPTAIDPDDDMHCGAEDASDGDLPSQPRVIALEGGLNFRDLGGYRARDGRQVRWRTIFRAGSTHALTASDRTSLAALGIRSIVDFRSLDERERHPHGLLGWPDVAYCAQEHNFAAGRLRGMAMDPGVDGGRMHAAMLTVYARLPFEFAEIYRRLFERLTNGPLPLVFNCAAGKDRTGVAAALLLTALGVAWEDVMADYTLTARVMPDIVRAFGRDSPGGTTHHIDPAVVHALFGVDAAYLDAMRSTVEQRCGSIDNYLATELRLDDRMLDHLRGRLLSRLLPDT